MTETWCDPQAPFPAPRSQCFECGLPPHEGDCQPLRALWMVSVAAVVAAAGILGALLYAAT